MDPTEKLGVPLTPEDQAQLDEQRNAPEPQDTPEVPQEGAGTQEKAAADTEKPAPRMVDHAALVEERERRKEAERTGAENQRRWEERFNALLQRVPQPQQPEQTAAPQIPTVDQDVVGHIVGSMQQIRETQAQQAQQNEQQRTEQQQAALRQAIQQRALAMEAEYSAENADYAPAISYLTTLRNRQLAAAGVVDPTERQAIINQEAMAIAYRALQGQRNPAEDLYKIAEASGYAKPQGEAANAAPADPAQNLQRIARGQQQNRGLGNVGGSAPPPLTAQKLMEMPVKDFDKFLETNAEARKLLGA